MFVVLDRLSSLSAGSVRPEASAKMALRQPARKLEEDSGSNQAHGYCRVYAILFRADAGFLDWSWQ